MKKSVFLHEFKEVNGVRLPNDWILFRRPLELYNLETDETVPLKNLEQAYQFEINGKTIKDIIEDADIHLFDIVLDGGRGASSGGNRSFKFGHASGGGGGSGGEALPPAAMNVKVSVHNKTAENALQAFAKRHANSDIEYGATIDENGYFTKYVKGGRHSVAISGKKGEMVLHNHPSGGAFSDTDLISTAATNAKGIVASGKHGNYIFEKTNKFNASGFTKAVKNATMTGSTYETAVDKWLKNNQSKYGYKYRFDKASR